MKLQDLLRHIADNVENGESWTKGLAIPEKLTTVQEVWCNHFSIELKPRTHVVNGFTVPAQEVESLPFGTEYWTIDFSEDELVYNYIWDDDTTDEKLLSRNIVFLTAEAAIANAKAMLGIDPYSEGEE